MEKLLYFFCIQLLCVQLISPMEKKRTLSDPKEVSKQRVCQEASILKLQQELAQVDSAPNPSQLLQEVCMFGDQFLTWDDRKNYISRLIVAGASPHPTLSTLSRADPLFWALCHQDHNFVYYLLRTKIYPANIYQLIPWEFKNPQLYYTFEAARCSSVKETLLLQLSAHIRSAVKAKEYDIKKRPKCGFSIDPLVALSYIYHYYNTQLQNKIINDSKQPQPENISKENLRTTIHITNDPLPEEITQIIEDLKPRIPILNSVAVLVTNNNGHGYADSNTIYLNPSKLQADCTPHAQQFVIAHEAKHVEAQDQNSGLHYERLLGPAASINKNLHQLYRFQEVRADIEALLLGPDMCQGLFDFANRIEILTPNHPDSNTHPSMKKRLAIAEIISLLYRNGALPLMGYSAGYSSCATAAAAAAQ